MRMRLRVLVATLIAALAAAAAGPAPPARAPVATSRGRFDLQVYAPPPPQESGRAAERPLILMVSGEGGWRSFDDLVATTLAGAGDWVGGVDAKAYFDDPQDNRAILAFDLRVFAAALAGAAGRAPGGPLILAGYSFGADIAPWAAGAGGWDGRVRGLLLIGPDENGSLQYRFTEMLGIDYTEHTFPVAGALRGAAGIPAAFIHGAKDGWSSAPKLFEVAAGPKRLFTIPGATHHFGGHEDELRAALRDAVDWLIRTGAPPAPGAPER